MASSPPAHFPTSLPNSKKRPSMSSQVSVSSSKRPKLHPLRQTSFPAHTDAYNNASAIASARSETGSVADSTLSRSTNKAPPRGRGRPRKSIQITDDDARNAREGGSATGTSTGRHALAKSVISAARSGPHGDEEEDDEEEDDIDTGPIEGKDADEQKREDEKMSVFLGQLTDAQSERFNNYRIAKLRESVVKRIVNQTVSQSVGVPAINAVQFFTKAFVIEIIERAREVQIECAKAADAGIQGEKAARRMIVEEKEVALQERRKALKAQDPPTDLPEQEERALQQEIQRAKIHAEAYMPNKHRGGLLPDHLREALRRYKADGDGNGFGFDGLSHPLLGVKGSNAWRVGDGAAGQRLFR